MTFRITAIATLALSLAGCAQTVEDRVEQRDSPNATLSQYRTWIAEARQRYPYTDPEQSMVDVMMCESGGDASKVNQSGPNAGLFQYSDQTWKGEWNDYRSYNMLKPKVQIFATAQAWQKNMQHQWGCYSAASTATSTQATAKPALAPSAPVPQVTVAHSAPRELPTPAAPVVTPAAPALPAATPQPAPGVAPGASSGNSTIEQYKTWITEARSRHPYADSEQRMFDVMMCESRGKASIVNPQGPYSGLFQYANGTWNGGWNDYRSNSVLDARAQIFATAQAWQKNMQRQWGCYTRGH